ncbi:hypothetical protein MIMGU_mgv1a012064mg [Erythranthe guttata]|uniref:Thioredoxin domain-containing protein n=1 Tax=Erythranthe guttata TaxID=4155 RepID=A0A022RN15_ERYGU|nr:PREDICTED: thioredoxin-like protein AAED1, chloroplastic [Erythranthe guttata]EYU41366.1 hypothetical protein MIMGU_mgv1a012064mg [Erythranthe guttata]|eukprot:XP_012832565.1 PREDICTED: thioredoxin-like protein AAED1, chloroplastic [Erythranthe guttata]
MAKLISQGILTPSASLLSPSTHSHKKSLFPPQSFAISTKHVTKSKSLLPGNPSRPPSLATTAASTAAAAVVPDDVADVLGEVSIFTAAGEPVKFKDLWDQQEGTAVVALLRHFGCFCCWELALALRESKEKFESAGVKLIAVGIGTPDKAQLLAERLPFPLDSLYCDPDRKAYELLGLYFGFRRTFLNPASTKVFSRFEEVKKATKNYTIKATPDDTSSVLQQGGMFVFKGKQLLYARKDEGTGDHAPLDDIFEICCNVSSA